MLTKKIDQEIGYTEKRNKVLEKVETIKPIKVNKALRKRRLELTVRLWNKGIEKKDIKHFKDMIEKEKNNYFKRMFSGEKIDKLSWDQCVDKTFIKIEKPKVVKALGWKNGIKKMFGFSQDDQCSFCGQQLSKKKKKRKKHLDKCNKKEKSQKTKFCEICKFSEKFCHCSAKQKDWKNSVRSRYNHDLYPTNYYNGNGLNGYDKWSCYQ